MSVYVFVLDVEGRDTMILSTVSFGFIEINSYIFFKNFLYSLFLYSLLSLANIRERNLGLRGVKLFARGNANWTSVPTHLITILLIPQLCCWQRTGRAWSDGTVACMGLLQLKEVGYK